MARRKTRNVTRHTTKPTRLRVRSTALRAVRAGVGVFIAGFAALFRAITPSRETCNGLLSAAWHSRGVRRSAGLIGGITVLGLISWIMLHNLRTEAQYTVDPGRIELASAPSWATGSLAAQLKTDIEEDLRADLGDLPEASAFDESVMETVSQRIQQSPWVRRVVRIERRFPTDGEGYSRLLAVLEIRTPAVSIETADRYVLIDGDGIVLPVMLLKNETNPYAAFAAQLARPLRNVRGVEGTAPAAGDTWGSEQVSAALSMERVIRQSELDKTLPIEGMELIGIPQQADARGRVFYQSEGGVVLVPDQSRMPGTRLMWGRPPVHSSTLERSPNDKLAELMARLREMDSVADQRIDLRYKG
jgi:hypothetical protein